jgi:alpha-L-fucosidase
MKQILLIILVALHINSVFGQWGSGEKYPDLKPNAEALKAFQDMKFGMFVHWGPSVIRGTSSWARGNHPYDFAPRIPINEYDSLYIQFNPVLFDAADWISTAKAAGMKYFVMVTKHHDGFCNWASDYTDYDIMSTPYKNDILKQLRDECEKQGILFGTYYSICDWHHPEYPGRYGGDPRPAENSDMEKYMVYMKQQLDELIDTYHSQIMWFDGYWEGPWTHERGMDLYKYLRDKKPDLLINNRVDRMRADEEGKIHPEKYAGDYKTPEQEIGAFDIEHPWESCVTISDGWFYRPQGRLKSMQECINLLVQTVGGGGNLLLDIGPMADGRMEYFQKKRLKEIGSWLAQYGESIYGTTGGPFKPNQWTASTKKGNKIYLHVLDWPSDTLMIPNFNQPIKNSYIVGGETFQITKSNDNLLISIPKNHRKKYNTILAFETEVPATDIPVLEAATFKNVKTVSLKNQPDRKYTPGNTDILVDGKKGTSSNLYDQWFGFEGEDFEATIDLQRIQPVSEVAVEFLEDQNTWIFLPKMVEISISENGTDFSLLKKKDLLLGEQKQSKVTEFKFAFSNTSGRFIKITAKNIGTCPEWHKGAGGKAWLFVDEITIE